MGISSFGTPSNEAPRRSSLNRQRRRHYRRSWWPTVVLRWPRLRRNTTTTLHGNSASLASRARTARRRQRTWSTTFCDPAGAKTGMVGTVAIRIGDREELHPSRQTTPESSDIQRYLRQMVDASVTWAILEATSHGLAMHRLDHVRFDIAAVTNITREHLDYHGTVENYQLAKAILLERVAADSGVAVVNADDAGSRAIEHFAYWRHDHSVQRNRSRC